MDDAEVGRKMRRRAIRKSPIATRWCESRDQPGFISERNASQIGICRLGKKRLFENSA